MYNSTYISNKGHKAMDMILTVICMVLCNRVPKGCVSFRTDGLATKIKLVMPPRGVEVRTRIAMEKANVTPDNPKGTEQEVVIEKNTNEKAVVRILVPKRTVTYSEFNAEQQQMASEMGDGAAEGGTEKPETAAAPGNDESKAQENSVEAAAAARAS